MKQIEPILTQLDELIRSCGEHLEGNSFYIDGQHGVLSKDFEEKRKNLLYYAMDSESILEIGFNGGHSCLLYLFANPYSKIQLHDLGNHRYSKPCFDFLDNLFPDRLSIVWGSSVDTMLGIDEKFDLIHIDGGHTYDILSSDIENCIKVAKADSTIIVDDVSFHPTHMIPDITRCVVEQLIIGNLIQVVPPFFCDLHFVAKLK